MASQLPILATHCFHLAGQRCTAETDEVVVYRCLICFWLSRDVKGLLCNVVVRQPCYAGRLPPSRHRRALVKWVALVSTAAVAIGLFMFILGQSGRVRAALLSLSN